MAGYGYGISVSGSRTPVVASGGGEIIPSSGLSLWLKADAGVTISQTPYIAQVILTGFTGIYAGANGTYNYNYEENWWYQSGGSYYINSGGELRDDNDQTLIATNNNNFQGAWSPSNYFSTITLSNAGDSQADGVYTRSDTSGYYGEFTASGGRYIAWDPNDGNFWFTDGDLYRNYNDLAVNGWDIQEGEEPVPTAVNSSSARNVGSPTSTTTTIPNPVQTWADQSGSSRVLYNNSGTPFSVVISGKNFINFPANTDLYSDNTIWPDSQMIGTIFCVARFASSSAGDTAYLFRHEGVEGLLSFNRGLSNTNAFSITTDGVDVVGSSTNANNNTNYLLGATFSESLVATLYLNGAPTGSGGITNNNGLYAIYIGGGLEPSNIAEMVVYNRVLTTEERQQVEAYLNTKYAIY